MNVSTVLRKLLLTTAATFVFSAAVIGSVWANDEGCAPGYWNNHLYS